MADDPVAVARRIAEDVLFPAALDVDRTGDIPPGHFDALAEAGFYGPFVPAELGGLGLDGDQLDTVAEVFAGACMATTFVWIQHFGLLGSLLGHAGDELGQRWLGPAVRGELRGGLALAGLQPGPSELRVERTGDDWTLHGRSRWVTGWGLVGMLQVVARTAGPDEHVATFLVDAVDQPGLTVTPQRLAAVDAGRTVQLDFDGVVVAGDRLVDDKPYDPTAYLKSEGLRLTGSLATGLAVRCCTLMGPTALDHEVAACRDALDAAEGDAIFVACAAASELAVRAAAALAVHTGSGAIVVGTHAERLLREALFLLVFATRPGIKSSLVDRLGAGTGQ